MQVKTEPEHPVEPQSIEPVQPVQPVEVNQQPGPDEPTETFEPVETFEPIEPIKPIEPIEPIEPARAIKKPAIVLVGKTGSGKSTLGNMLLGKDAFATSNDFDSETKVAETRILSIQNRQFNLIDTPGVFDTSESNDVILREISRIIRECAFGVQAIIFVIEAGRYTDEQKQMVKVIVRFLGEESLKHMIICFSKCNKKQTRDNLIKLDSRCGIQEFVNSTGKPWVIVPNPEMFEPDTEIFMRQMEKLKTLISEFPHPYTTELFDRIRKSYEEEERMKRETEEKERNLQVQFKREAEELQERFKREAEERERKLQEQFANDSKRTQEEIGILRAAFNKESEERGNALKRAEEAARQTQEKMREENERRCRQLEEERANAIKRADDMSRETQERLQNEVSNLMQQLNETRGELDKLRNSGCFFLGTLVTLEGGKSIPLSKVDIGDKILTRSSGGRLEYSEIYLFADYDIQCLVEYIRVGFSMENGTKGHLLVTPDHHVFANNTIDFAGNLEKGSAILTFYEGSFRKNLVGSVTTEWHRGFTSVLTRSGTLVANGVLCSCFSEVPPSPMMQVVGQMALAPLRAYTRIIPSTYRGYDVHPYVKVLTNIVSMIESIVHVLGKEGTCIVFLVVAVLVFGYNGLETLRAGL